VSASILSLKITTARSEPYFYLHTEYAERWDCIVYAVCSFHAQKERSGSVYNVYVLLCVYYSFGCCWLQLFSPLCIYNYGSSGAVTTFVARDELPVSGHHAMMDLSAKSTQKCVLIFNIARPAPAIMVMLAWIRCYAAWAFKSPKEC
jgi:hypothetical protein